MKSRVILFIVFLTSVFALSLAVAPAPPATAAVGTTYTVTSTSCTGPGSITEAMALANANSGEDTITFTPGLQIQAGTCPEPPFGFNYFILHATESVIIEGNGAKVAGYIKWISSGGIVNPLDRCPVAEDVVASLTPGFIKVGLLDQDNSAITVTVRNLDLQELNSVARIEENASLILEDLEVNTILPAAGSCNDPAVNAQGGANFTARRTHWSYIIALREIVPETPFAYVNSAFSGGGPGLVGAGNLTLEDSFFGLKNYGGAIYWDGQPGSKVNVVTSRFDDFEGISIVGAATTNIVNTIWSNERLKDTSRIYNLSSGEMNIVASTILFFEHSCDTDCNEIGRPGLIYRYDGAGKINLVQSAIDVATPNADPNNSLEVLEPDATAAGAGFSADEYTWVVPTDVQDANALKTVTNQPNLLTVPPVFAYSTQAQWATPLDPGELIDIVPDAKCGQANQLLNPIDGNCITEDALGNPRVDANGKRNSGAVQLALAPFLTVIRTGDGTVDLSWTKPQFSDPATGITGYELRYRPTGAGSWEPSIIFPDENTLAGQVTGLTNGTEYEFEVRATYAPGGEGPWSNNVTGTPFGPIGTPVVTATPGNTQVDLSWTKPSDGGRVIDTYTILWRPVGTTSFTGTKATFGTNTSPPATQTTITGLTNGTEYEFFVTANANAVVGPQGRATATPFAPGQVDILKFTAPAGGAGFSFSQTIDGSGDFTLDHQGKKVFTNVTPGAYTVTEADPQALGYELTGLTCSETNLKNSSGDVATRTVTINVESNETVSCAFFNSEEETVVIEKRTIPSGGSSDFNFIYNIGTVGNFTLSDTETRTFTSVPQGNYTVQENTNALNGYKLTAIDCNVEGQSVAGNLETGSVNFSLTQAGGSAHCTFTNTKLGTIVMRKQTLPDGASDSFGYTISGRDYSKSGSLRDDEFEAVPNAQPGTWTLAETLPSAGDWHLGDISCTSTLGTSTFTNDRDNLKTTVELAPGDTMACTFTNVEDETITVEKVTVPAGDTTTDFAFTGSPAIGGFTLKDGEKQSFSVDAEAGPYTLTETDPSPAGYEVTEIRCVNTQTGEITLGDLLTRSVELDTEPGDSQHCTFTNELHGEVVIRKATAPAGDTINAFGFYGSFGSFALKDGEDKTILDVAPGAYSVSEADPTSLGYGLSGIRCTDSDPNGTPSTSDLPTHTATLNVDAGETVECTFINSDSVCPVDPNVGTLQTDLLGVGQGSPTKGIRTRKLVIPNYQNVDSLYGQLAAVDVGVMKYVRFRYPNGAIVQVKDATSLAYRMNAVSWWGSDLTPSPYVKGQFFWGAKGSRSPRAFVLWPTYTTTEEYANVFTVFDESTENHVYWDVANGWYADQTQTIAIPETQVDGAAILVKVALVDNNKDGRPVILTVSAGNVSQQVITSVPSNKDLLNLEEILLENVPRGTSEVVLHLASPAPSSIYPAGGDSVAMIGAAASYSCELPTP